MRQKILKLAAEHFECAEDDLEIANGEVSVVGVPGQAVKLGALALEANPMRGAVKPGTEPGLESTQYFGPPGGATASGVHAMIVEVDPQTFTLEVLKYVVVHDCGTVINPLILAGQIHGGVAQGIGNAFYEQLVFDDDGQLLNASLADYLLPTALEVPRMEIAHTVTPSPLNPLGIKGAGEAGAIPVGPLFAQAIEDALGLLPQNIELNEIPLSPNRLFELTANPAKPHDRDDPGHRRRGQDRQSRRQGAGGQGRDACARWCAARACWGAHGDRRRRRRYRQLRRSARARLAPRPERARSIISAPMSAATKSRYARAVAAAARAQGVARFVYHSVLHPQIEAMPHHWAEDAGRGDAVCQPASI